MRNKDVKTSQINDVAKWLVVGECSEVGERDNSADYAYDTCQLKCSTVCGGDWVNCSWSEACSIDSPKYQLDPTTRKTDPKSRPRHLGGMNVGFADGHASWFDSEAILFGGGIAGQYVPAGNLIENLSNCGFPPYP
jgi:prepilin-type processing-associated H-X9-DG protein